MIKILLMAFCFLIGTFSKAQDTLSIDKFDSLVTQHHEKMKLILKSEDTLSSNEAVILVKIENTLHYGVENYIGNKELSIRIRKYQSFDSCFNIYFIRKIIHKLDATIYFGMGYYSKKYDILLGGNLTDPKSRYYIKN
ncbi:MAG TPA: hypothetical protein VFI29_15785 [Hanamia sp.]|nr:hypothetical protein [Hanamia sp.]